MDQTTNALLQYGGNNGGTTLGNQSLHNLQMLQMLFNQQPQKLGNQGLNPQQYPSLTANQGQSQQMSPMMLMMLMQQMGGGTNGLSSMLSNNATNQLMR